jgi:two-component system chemotaxis sensor kinase CheA
MDDLIAEFITEASENISTLDLELVKLEQNPEDHAILSNIFRLVHTIKGTCGFLGLSRLEKVAHASENVLGKIRDRKLQATPQAVSLVLESLDVIRVMIEHLGSKGTEQEGDDTDLITRLNKFAESGAAPEAPAPAAPAPPAVATEEAKAAAPPPPREEVKPAPPPAAVVELPAPKVPPPVEPKKNEQAENKETSNQTIRINIEILEHLMQMVSELVLTRNQLMQIARTKSDKDFLNPLQNLSHITTELQEEVMKTRMQPIGNAWAKFPRLVRDLSLELGKKIELRMVGAETELDRQLLEMIKDPLTHMVRNSCDHGIEKPDERKASGKPEAGTITLSAFHEGGHIIVEISDDGKGIPIERVKEKLANNGLASQSELANMGHKQILQYIFRPGFSTAEKVTSVSGRGVGMDVVKTNIEKIGGTIELDSVQGKGSVFGLKIPLTLAIVSTLIIESHGERYAIPQINVSEIVRIGGQSDYVIETVNQTPVMRLRDRLLPLLMLATVLNLEQTQAVRAPYVVVCKVGGFEFGLVVDRVFDTEEIVVKPVSEVLKSIPIYSGNTILGDGSVILILDPNGIARTFNTAQLLGKDEAMATANANITHEPVVKFLLFACGDGTPKAVPLELVSRLEEIDVSTMERSGEQVLVQYRGDLMRLISLTQPMKLPLSGAVDVVVFTYDNKALGLVVETIIDIVEVPFKLKIASQEKGYLGTMVVNEKVTDVVDVGNLLSDLVGMVDMTDVNVQSAKDCYLLLVEDSPFYRNLTVPFLSAVGYRVTAAAHANEALQLLHRFPNKFNAIVTDIEMPGINGYEFVATCRREIPSLARLPILAYTSTVNNETLAMCKEAGIDDCIIKTDRGALLKSIARHLAIDKEAA